MANYYYSGQGSLYTATRDGSGNPEGFVAVGNVPELTIDIEVTNFEHKESESGQRLIDLVITREKKGTFAFKLENLSLDNLALGLYGTAASVTGSSVTNELVTAFLDKRCPLAHPDVSAVVVKDNAAAVTYVLDTDYTLDAKNGVIVPLTSGAITASEVLKVSYTYATYNKLDVFMTTAPERWLRFEGLNTADTGSRVIVDIFKAQFDPLTGYGLIVEELAAADMKGTILSDATKVTGSKFFRQRNVSA